MLSHFFKKLFGFKRSSRHFGVHLMIDGYGGDPAKLNDYNIVFNSLDRLPELIGMKKMTKTVVLEAPPVNEKDGGGYSGIVMINSSHMSCHTFPKRRFVSIDVYTCHESMNHKFVKKYFKDAFDLQDMEINYVKRGTRYPVMDLE